MVEKTTQMVAYEDLNLIHDEEYRQFCRKSYFQKGDGYKIMQINKAARNEFIVIQAAKVNTECNFQLTALSKSNDAITLYNIFPTDHTNQNVIVVVACSKLLHKASYFRIWYHNGGILRKKPLSDSEGLKYVQLSPEPRCTAGNPVAVNKTNAFVHVTMLRMRLPLTNETEEIWRNIGNAPDMQVPKFRTYNTLTNYQKSIFVPDSYIGKHSSTIAPDNSVTFMIIALVPFIFSIYRC